MTKAKAAKAATTPEAPVEAPKKEKGPTLQSFAWNFASIWFGQSITSRANCEERLDLQPHAALCLLAMATESVATAQDIQFRFSRVLGGPFDKAETHILVEYGLWSLLDNGYIRLDKKGEAERAAHDHHTYGLGYIRWLMTAKGAKLITAAYCTIKGLPSEYQTQAVQDILAANKAAVKKSRADSAAQGF